MERTPISLSNVKGNTEGASLAFAGESTLKFDASSLSANALFTAEGKQGKLTATDAKVNIEASNLSWGRYYLFENFDTEGVTKENFVTEDGKLVAADKWSEPASRQKITQGPETMDDRVRRLLYLGLTRASARIELVVSAQAMAALNAAAG